jgi:predicted N-acetyltransferase YhbS
MSTELTPLAAVDFQDAMDFLNLVFGAHRPHDFERLLPALYQPTDEAMACNYAVREDGRIRGIVGMYPMRWQLGDVCLKVAGIGAVSTHPKSRGAGHMKALMHHCVSSMREQGCQLSYLGGQRQRYGYFGYERCGHVLQFNLTQANLRHCFGQLDPGVHFAPLTQDDQAWLRQARELHDLQPTRCHRAPADFYNHLLNWYSTPHVALDSQGQMLTYLVANKDGSTISELPTEDDALFLRVLRAWAGQRPEVSLPVSPLQPNRARLLYTCCEGVSVRSSGNWQIFDWPAVLGALLDARNAAHSLAPGRVCIGIQGVGAIELGVDRNDTFCTLSDREPDLSCDTRTAMRLLFGPTAPSLVMELPSAARMVEQWCPLPLHWHHQDGV